MKVPAPQTIYKWEIKQLLGCDLTEKSANVDSRRSPECPNMIRESVGNVRKRTGKHTVKSYPYRVNGVHFFSDTTGGKKLIHAGANIYLDGGTEDVEDDTVLYTEANDGFSHAVQLNKLLLIVDGKKALLFGKHNGTDYTIVTAESKAYVPTVTIGRAPTGGGTVYDPVNLIGSGRTDSFLGTEDAVEYQLSATELDDTAVTAKKMTSEGTYTDLSEGTDFSVDRTTGKVAFTAAPGASPVTGEDNIQITYYKTPEGYADKINKCDICTLYGANGARDRAFIAGNPALGNQDYYCQKNDPTYFGDLWYTVLGQDGSLIMGYSVVNDKLAAVLDGSDDETNIIMRNSSLDDDGEVIFVLAGSYQGKGAKTKHAFGVLKTEPLFVTDDGVYAITPSDVIGERYAQERSYRLRGLIETLDMTNAYGTAWKDFYCIAAGEYILLLDGLQTSTEKNKPYATRQYECYYFTDINARVLYTEGEALCFGDADGNIAAFYTDASSPSNYNDNGEAYYCGWKTPEFYGDDSSYKKRFKRIAALLGAYVKTSCTIYAVYDGIKELVVSQSAVGRYFSFQYLTFSQLTFKSDNSPQLAIEKLSIKPDNRNAQFVFESEVKNEPFALYEAVVEYTERR